MTATHLGLTLDAIAEKVVGKAAALAGVVSPEALATLAGVPAA